MVVVVVVVGVGVGEHLTQAPFVLRAGVCITMGFEGWVGGAAANCSKRNGQGMQEQCRGKTILLGQLPLGHYVAHTHDHLCTHLRASPGLHFLLSNHSLCCELSQTGAGPFSPAASQTQVQLIRLHFT